MGGDKQAAEKGRGRVRERQRECISIKLTAQREAGRSHTFGTERDGVRGFTVP